jgi:hypothetical protein
MSDYESIKEWIISENDLDEFIEMTSERGEAPHRGICALLQTLREYAYGWRDKIQLVIFNDDGPEGAVSATFDEEYQAYLDKKAQREPAIWKKFGESDEEE